MRQAAQAPERAAESAQKMPGAPARPSAGIPLDLKPLIAPYQQHRRITLRVEKLPQTARFSAGRNNGDNSWSLDLYDLEGLSYFPPEGFNKAHTLTIRVIVRNDAEASSIAAVDFHVPSADERSNAVPSVPPTMADKTALDSLDRALQAEVLALKTMLAARDTELGQIQGSLDQANADWQKKLDEALSETERTRSAAEVLRLAEAKAVLQAQFEKDLAEIKRRAQMEVDQYCERDAALLRQLQQELAESKGTLASREEEKIHLLGKLESLQHAAAAEISAVKKAAAVEVAEKLKAVETVWQTRTTQSLAEAARQRQTAETRLAETKALLASREAERNQLLNRIQDLQQASTVDAATAPNSAPEITEKLKATEASLVLVMERHRAAETALEDTRALLAGRDHEQSELLQRLQDLEQTSAAEISAVKKAVALEAAEKVNAAEASVAELTERCEAAERALVSARAAASKAKGDDAYVHGLQREIGSLRKALVDREADLAHAKASLDQFRHGMAPPMPSTNWQPLSNRPQTRKAEKASANNHLMRDVVIIFVVVISAVLAWPFVWPQIEAFLPDGLFDSQSEQVTQAPPAPSPPKPLPKPEPPMATVMRGVNLRAEPKMGATVLAGLNGGDKVELLGQSGNWDQVAVKGTDGKTLQGWVYGSYLQVPPGKQPQGQAGTP